MLAALYQSKHELRENIGKALLYRETSIFGNQYKADGVVCVVGPDEYRRRWFAEVVMENGLIKRVL